MDDRSPEPRNAIVVRPRENADANVHLLSTRPAGGTVPTRDGGEPVFTGLKGVSDAIVRVRELLHEVAATGAGVLILGESGTGKGGAARQIHRLSQHRDGPYLVNASKLSARCVGRIGRADTRCKKCDTVETLAKCDEVSQSIDTFRIRNTGRPIGGNDNAMHFH